MLAVPRRRCENKANMGSPRTYRIRSGKPKYRVPQGFPFEQIPCKTLAQYSELENPCFNPSKSRQSLIVYSSLKDLASSIIMYVEPTPPGETINNRFFGNCCSREFVETAVSCGDDTARSRLSHVQLASIDTTSMTTMSRGTFTTLVLHR